MACGIGVCMTCVLPVVGEDGVTRMVRSCVDGPVFPAERVRWADVGHRAAGRPGRARRAGRRAAAPGRRRDRAGGRRGRPVHRARRGRLAQPGADRVRLRGRRPGAGAVLRPWPRSARWSPSRSCWRPRSGRPTPRMAETPSGMLNSIGLQGPGIDAFLAHDLPWLAERGRPGGGLHRRRQRRGVRRAGPPAARTRRRWSRSRSTSPARTWRTAARSSPATRTRPPGWWPRSGPRRRPAIPVLAKLSPDVTDIVAVARACVDAGADGLSMINTLLGLVIDPDTHAPGAGRHHRRAVRAGDPAGRGALRLAGARGAAGRADPRHGRDPHRAGRAAVRARRGVRGVGRAPRSSTTRPRPAGCWPSCAPRSPSAASPGSPTPSATPTGPRSATSTGPTAPPPRPARSGASARTTCERARGLAARAGSDEGRPAGARACRPVRGVGTVSERRPRRTR